jgi:predicted ATPase
MLRCCMSAGRPLAAPTSSKTSASRLGRASGGAALDAKNGRRRPRGGDLRAVGRDSYCIADPTPHPFMPASISTQYVVLVAAAKIERDHAQEAIVEQLAQLERRLAEHRLARKSSSLGWVFGARKRSEEPIKGLYIFGDVGRGKTMLMDLFFAASPIMRKRRAHFHEFMADVHERIYAFRQRLKSGELGEQDPIGLTAAAIAEETWLLCFDEFHVTDIVCGSRANSTPSCSTAFR